MGTRNFYIKNASRTFSFGMNYQDEDGNTVYPDEWEYNDTRSNIYYELEKVCEEKGYYIEEDNSWLGDDSRVICEISKSHPKYDILGISISIICLSRIGYYEGAVMDWQIGVINIGHSSGDSMYELQDLISDIEIEYAEDQRGLAKIHAKHILKWLEKSKDELVDVIEKVYEQFTDKPE